MKCETAQTQLLDHLYGLLDEADDAALQEHLHDCDACRAALDSAYADADLLAEAARMEAGDLEFAPPSETAPTPWRQRLMALAVAASALIAVGVIAHHSAEAGTREQALARHPHLTVSGPSTVGPDAPAEFLLSVKDANGKPLAARLHAEARSAAGAHLHSTTAKTDAKGEARLLVRADQAAPGELVAVRFTVEIAGAPHGFASAALLRNPSHLVARISTDKPLYRPGEPLRVRTVALERFRLKPAGDTWMHVRLLGPSDVVIAQQHVSARRGVGAAVFTVPQGSKGGEYRAVVTDPGGSFPEATQKFVVRDFRPPRLRWDLELDRDAYAPGASGAAELKIERAEGGVPAGARVEATLSIGGEDTKTVELTVPESGLLRVPFTVPEKAEAARGVLALVVRDGGAVESITETVRITQDRLDVAYFPESGDLVAGLRTRVYFRVRDAAGEPADLRADVLDSQGRRVTDARVDALGMGAFDLLPKAGETYRLVARAPNGLRLDGRMPGVRDRGGSVRALELATEAGRPVRVEVASTTAGEHIVVAACRGTVIAQERVTLEAGRAASIRLQPPAESDVGGVVRVTLTDPSGLPLAERLVSRASQHQVRLSVEAGGTRYAPGEKVRVNITARDEDGEPVEAVLGVTVVDDAVLALADDDDTPSLPMHFLLGLEVDELEDVQVYGDGARGRLAVDRLLGVQGWRRFAWRDVGQFLKDHPKAGLRVVRTAIEPAASIAVDNGDQAKRLVKNEIRRGRHRREKGLGAILAVLGLIAAAGTIGVGIKKKANWARVGGAICLISVIALALPEGTLKSNLGAEGADSAVPTADAVPVESKAAMPRRMRPPAPGQPIQMDRGWGPVEQTVVLFAARDEPVATPGLAVQFLNDEGLELRAGDVRRDFSTLFQNYRYATGGGAGAGHATMGWRMLRIDAGKTWTMSGTRPAGIDTIDPGYGYTVVREYAHEHAGGTKRADFTQVLYWNPLIITDANGRAHFEFDTSDSLTTYRIGVEAHDGRGALADTSRNIQNRVPFAIEPKLPIAVSAGDEIELPVSVTNDTGTPLTVNVAATVDSTLLGLEGEKRLAVDVPANSRTRVTFRMRAAQGAGTAKVTLTADAGTGLSDHVERTVQVQPRGYPIHVAAGGMLKQSAETTFALPDDLDPYGLEGSLTVFPSVLGELIVGLDAMLAMPHGCFEQVSSSNYPNVLALRFLRDHDLADPALSRRAREYLDSGYEKLTAYRCSNGGYDLWGKDPGHLALSAYGLVQFHDMAAVYPVDPKVIEDVRGWLLDKRDGKGGFEPARAGGHGFGGTTKEIVDAYVTWALVETGSAKQLAKELDALAAGVPDSKDPYFLALASAALHGAGRDADAALDRLAALQRSDGSFWSPSRSITASTGSNMEVETTSLATLALLREARLHDRAGRSVQWLGTKRQGGRFGSTQATVLALRALHAYSGVAGVEGGDTELKLSVNGKVVATQRVSADQVQPVRFTGEFTSALVPGENVVAVASSAERAMPWATSVRYRTTSPPNDPKRVVDLTTTLRKDEVDEGATVRLDVVLTNRLGEAVPNPLVRIAIPAGLEPRAKQLEELKKAGRFAFYETRPREVTLYYRGIEAGATERIGLDLVATVPGTFEGPASSAYPYYGDDAKAWAAPIRVMVRKRR